MSKEPTFGNGKICYLEIPAIDIPISVNFYKNVFGWNIREHGDGAISFDDGVNEVSGMWVTNRKPMTEAGIIISIMVDDAKATVESIINYGGAIAKQIEKDFPEITAHFKDPAGNIMGIYQHGGN